MRCNKGKIPPRYLHRIDENRSLWMKWNGMKRRCLNCNDERYKDYGGRGIRMYKPWIDSFDVFADWAISNGYKDNLTIERVDVNGDYCPENCIWIPLADQNFNKRQTLWVDYKGRHIQLIKLCNEKGKNYDTVHNRITKMGWDVERAIDTPSIREGESLMHKCTVRGLNYGTVRDRILKLGWTEEMALSVPTGRGRGAFYGERNIKANCLQCGNEFLKTIGTQKYCSAACREKSKCTRRKAHLD